MIYAIGDVQGCYEALQALLALVNFNPSRDEIWLVGDLVCRGPQSLETLRFVKQLFDQGAARVVLGNHDVYLLAILEGLRSSAPSDRIQDLLEAPDRHILAAWLRGQPLLYENEAYVMVHAGIWPLWSLSEARGYAKEFQAYFQKKEALRALFQATGMHWDEANTDEDRQRFILNSFTRMRFLHVDGRLDFEAKGDKASQDLFPWFALPSRISCEKTILFGHWSALAGETGLKNVVGLDTGCVWGRHLTAVRLSDGQKFQVSCAKSSFIVGDPPKKNSPTDPS